MERTGLRIAYTVGAWALLGVALSLPFGGCKLDTQGGGVFDVACANDTQCNDNDPCTADTCGSRGICGFVMDSSRVPDDANACTTDRCDSTGEVHEAANEGVVCKDGANSGFCKAGECFVACSADDQETACDDANPCTLDSCDLTSGKCVRIKLDATPTPGVTQKVGDCMRAACVKGVATEVIDDTDLPVNVECWEESCASGAPATTPSATDTACGWSQELKCDGAGKCVGCTDDSQCPRDDCNDGVCDTAGECVLDPKPVGTLLPDAQQTPNDCRVMQCDADGVAVAAQDDNDPPVADALECTLDECVGGVPLHPAKPKNTGCNQSGGSVCDGAEACVQCNDASQCTDPGECATRACTSNACVITPKAEGTACGASGGVCNGAGQCVGCTKPADCADPGECQHSTCTTNTCGAAPDPVNDPCATGYCDGASKCVECTTAAQCPAGNACNDPKCTGNACSLAPKTTGTTCPTGVCNASGVCVQCIAAAGCPDPGECETPACNNGTCGVVHDDKSVTCGTGWHCDGAGACVECNLASQCTGGTICLPKTCASSACVNGTPAAIGTPCGAGSECDGAGACKRVIGQTCTAPSQCLSTQCEDGVCCDTQCTKLCFACSAAKKGTGSDGTCGEISAGTDPDGECNGSHNCDGSGACD